MLGPEVIRHGLGVSGLIIAVLIEPDGKGLDGPSALGLHEGHDGRGVYAAGEEGAERSEEHTSELQSPCNLVCRLLLEKKKKKKKNRYPVRAYYATHQL